MVDLVDAKVAADMTEVERACWLAGKGNVEPLAKILGAVDRSLSETDRTFIAMYVRGDFKPRRGRPSNSTRSSYERQKTLIELAVEMVRRTKGARARFRRGEQLVAIAAAAAAYSLTIDQVASAYRRAGR